MDVERLEYVYYVEAENVMPIVYDRLEPMTSCDHRQSSAYLLQLIRSKIPREDACRALYFEPLLYLRQRLPEVSDVFSDGFRFPPNLVLGSSLGG